MPAAPENPEVRAVVFDFDGLILDTETPLYDAWAAVFTAHGCEPMSFAEWGQEVGSFDVLDPLELLRLRATITVDEHEVTTMRRDRHEALLSEQRVLPGVVQWIDEAASLGLGVAIASSSEYEWVDEHLTRIGLRARFDHLSCRDDVRRAKPQPDVYLAACAMLGVDPARAVAIEDSPHGIAAAHAAGLRCIAVPNPITRALDVSRADLRLAALTECSLADALTRLR